MDTLLWSAVGSSSVEDGGLAHVGARQHLDEGLVVQRIRRGREVDAARGQIRIEAIHHLFQIQPAGAGLVPAALLGVAIDVALPGDADAQRLEAHARHGPARLPDGPVVAAVVLEPRLQRHAREHAVLAGADRPHAVIHPVVVPHDRGVEEIAFVQLGRVVGAVRPVAEAAVLPAVEPGHRGRDLDALLLEEPRVTHHREQPGGIDAAVDAHEGGHVRVAAALVEGKLPGDVAVHTPGSYQVALEELRRGPHEARVLEERLDALDARVDGRPVGAKVGRDDQRGRPRLSAHLGAALEVALHREVRRGALEQLAHQGGPLQRLGQEDRRAAGGGHGAQDSAGRQSLGAPLGLRESSKAMAPALGLLLFLAASFAAVKYLPGRVVLGREEPDGTRFPYRINGLAVFAAANVAVAAGTLVFGLSLAPLIHHFWELFAAANAASFALALWLHLRAAGAGRTTLRQKLIGRELNPRAFGVDLKMWAYEPSLIGLGLLVAAFGYEQYERHGQITPQMGFWLIGWWIYLATHYAQQDFLLSIFDVIEERFGLMLLWGDLVLVPFFYSIAGWTLLDQHKPMKIPVLLGLAVLYG